MFGEFDLSTGIGSLGHTQVLNWSPLPGAFGNYFRVPSLVGSLSLGMDGVALAFFANATLPTITVKQNFL